MEPEESSKDLPEDLVEKIISMMPFPSIFKCRMLSKSWLGKFSSMEPSSQDDDDDDDDDETDESICSKATRRFQRSVSERSSKWEIFCPIRLSEDKESLGYNPATGAWQRIPSVPFLSTVCLSVMTTEGSLVFLPRCALGKEEEEELYVVNIVTRSWRVLPPRLRLENDTILLAKLVPGETLQTYRVVLIVQSHHTVGGVNSEFWVQIFSPNSCSWSNQKLVPPKPFRFLHSAVYLDGVVYMMGGYLRLAAFNIEQGTLTELNILNEVDTAGTLPFSLVVCNGNLFTIVTRNFLGGTNLHLRVLKVDLRLGTFSEVADGPPIRLHVRSKVFHGRPMGHGDCIYFGVEISPTNLLMAKSDWRVVVYNVVERCWSCVPYPALMASRINDGCSFQPGMNPFMAV